MTDHHQSSESGSCLRKAQLSPVYREDVIARRLRQRFDPEEVADERACLVGREGIEPEVDERVAEQVSRRRDESPAFALAIESRRRDDR